jgi:hypothetical protein
MFEPIAIILGAFFIVLIMGVLFALRLQIRLVAWPKLRGAILNTLHRREREACVEKTLLSTQAKHLFNLGKFVLDRTNPLVSASRLMLELGEEGIPAATEYLKAFYADQWRKSVTEYLEIQEDSVRKSHNLPSKHWLNPLEASLSPWDGQPIVDGNIQDRQSAGEQATHDVERLWTLITSIQTRGYQRHSGPDGDITCEALVSQEGKLRFQLISGNHRAAVLVALGQTRVPIRVVRFVTNERAEEWPKVQSGVFSLGGALERFDKFFSKGTEL